MAFKAPPHPAAPPLPRPAISSDLLSSPPPSPAPLQTGTFSCFHQAPSTPPGALMSSLLPGGSSPTWTHTAPSLASSGLQVSASQKILLSLPYLKPQQPLLFLNPRTASLLHFWLSLGIIRRIYEYINIDTNFQLGYAPSHPCYALEGNHEGSLGSFACFVLMPGMCLACSRHCPVIYGMMEGGRTLLFP